MITLLADANIQGHVARLVGRMQSDAWRDFWDHLELHCASFADVGLDVADSDLAVWRCCQEKELLLLTDNRNQKTADSLEATIRAHNSPSSLPVFTIADSRRMLSDSEYLDRIIDRLLRYLLELDAVRGAGRLYLP